MPIKFDALESAYDMDKVENGAWMPFTIDGEPRFITVAGKKYEVRARVRSVLSSKYDAHQDKVQQSTTNRARKLKGEEARRQLFAKEMKESDPKTFSVLVAEFENVSAEALGTITPPEDDLLHFALQPRNSDWVDQVLAFARDNSNYLASDTAGNVEAPAPAPTPQTPEN